MVTTWVRRDNSARAASKASAPRASRMRAQLRSASARASARPRPRDAPVITAVCEVGEVILRFLGGGSSITQYQRKNDPSHLATGQFPGCPNGQVAPLTN